MQTVTQNTNLVTKAQLQQQLEEMLYALCAGDVAHAMQLHSDIAELVDIIS
jgi:hypothetical protein